MYVCICKTVTEREVRSAVQLGAASLSDVRKALGVASCCGQCANCAKGIIQDERMRLPQSPAIGKFIAAIMPLSSQSIGEAA